MIKGRRVGTLTLGISLVAFGAMFMAHMLYQALSYHLILNLWPVILILLGLETILSCMINRQEVMKYDTGAILLVVGLSFFAMIMAGCEFALSHANITSGYLTLH